MSDALRKAAILPLLLGAGVPPAADPQPLGPSAALMRAEDGVAVPLALPPEVSEVRRIGPYRVLRALGSGGMGTVYLAESSSPPRRVALKVMREDRRGSRLAARFAVERQALAAAEHDFVARLYDSGVTAEGQPWLALELVEGEPLLEYCDRRRLDVEARLRLFGAVCEAVQHLHERGILHRDLKPANILVSPRGVPKVIDLGLARLDGRLSGTGITDVAPTVAEEEDDCVMGTPAYMAPEQLTLPSHELDARCDVYSLGLILRDLLVGPRTLERGPLDAVLRTALDGCPPSASLAERGSRAASIARRRSTRVSSLRRRLRGALDRITARAAAQRRDDRPRSAASLGAAIERDLVRHENRRRARRSLALALVSGVVGAAGGFFVAHVLG